MLSRLLNGDIVLFLMNRKVCPKCMGAGWYYKPGTDSEETCSQCNGKKYVKQR